MASFGKYKSVNDLTQFAAAVAEHGPYDPEVKVLIKQNPQGRYTIDGIDNLNADGQLQTTLNLAPFINNTIPGVRYLSNGLLQVDSENVRYDVYILDIEDGILPYSTLAVFGGIDGSYYMSEFNLPSDHPFLQAYVTP